MNVREKFHLTNLNNFLTVFVVERVKKIWNIALLAFSRMFANIFTPLPEYFSLKIVKVVRNFFTIYDLENLFFLTISKKVHYKNLIQTFGKQNI